MTAVIVLGGLWACIAGLVGCFAWWVHQTRNDDAEWAALHDHHNQMAALQPRAARGTR